MNHLTKKVSLLIMSGILGSGFAFSMPLISYASADAIGILGTVVGGALVYRELDDYMNRINNTEEGRQEYFNELKRCKLRIHGRLRQTLSAPHGRRAAP